MIQPSNSRFSVLAGHPYYAGGLVVEINRRLSLEFLAEDFEYEVALGRVELWAEGEMVRTCVILAPGSMQGVVHQFSISAVVDGERTCATGQATVEVRSQ